MVPSACAQVATTVPALRRSSIWRSSVRSAGTGMPVAVSRSVGSTSVSSSSGGSIVGRVSSTLTMPIPYTLTAHVVNT